MTDYNKIYDIANAKPYEEGMTVTENSWVVVDVSTEEGTRVTFYTPEQDTNEDGPFANLKDFSDIYLDDNFMIKERSVTVVEGKVLVQGSSTTEKDDYDEESGKSWKYFAPEAQIVDFYQKMDANRLVEIINQTETSLESLEKDAVAEAEDNEDYQKDPYAYYGVSRHDFL
jgi:hypothetical protein